MGTCAGRYILSRRRAYAYLCLCVCVRESLHRVFQIRERCSVVSVAYAAGSDTIGRGTKRADYVTRFYAENLSPGRRDCDSFFFYVWNTFGFS